MLNLNLNRRWMIAALVGSTAALGLAIAPLTAQADPPEGGRPRLERRANLIEELNLTDAQQAQFQEIRRDTRAQIADVFTEDQRQSFREGLEAGEPFPMVIQSLNLSDEQHDQLRSIMETSMERRRNVLTEEQREQLREHRGGWGRGMRGGAGTGQGGRGRGPGRGMGPGGGF